MSYQLMALCPLLYACFNPLRAFAMLTVQKTAPDAITTAPSGNTLLTADRRNNFV